MAPEAAGSEDREGRNPEYPLDEAAMILSLLDNSERTVRDALENACSEATRAYVAVAYAKASGLEVAPALEKMARGGAEVRFLAGLDFELTDLDALGRLDVPPSEARVYVNADFSHRQGFHPKRYLLEGPDRAVAIIGSSNLSAGGLLRNIEANVLIEATSGDPIIQGARAFHSRLWNSSLAFSVSSRFRDVYETLQLRRRKVELDLRAEADYERARRELRLAVAEAVAGIARSRERQCWLLITSPENYIRCIEGQIWGDEDPRRLRQVQAGDLVFFYVKRIMVVAAMALVTRGPYEDQTVYWQDGRIYPHRFDFVTLIRPSVQLPFRPLVPRLDLFERRDDPKWGVRLQAAMKPFSSHDCEILREALVLLERRAASA